MRPILVHLPWGLPLYAYGTMLCLSVIVGRLLAMRLAKHAGMDPALTDRCIVWTLVGACVGARLLYVVTNLDQFDGVLDVFKWWKGGLVAYGGFLGGFAGTWLFARRHRINVLAWTDAVAPSLCIGLLLTRIGCFLAGCDFGRPWNGPWAVRFPAGSIASQQQAAQGLIPSARMPSLPVHPTQLYESAAGLALLLIVLAVRRRQTVHGQAFFAFVLGYSIFRYVIEIFRADLDRGNVGPLSASQFIAVVTFLAAAIFLWRRARSRPVPSNRRVSV
jgi:phosphatidylglycerol---prolipoprotein diacylglyceryl transferase